MTEKIVPLHPKSGALPLDLSHFSLHDLNHWEAQTERILRIHWDLYSALAYERAKIADQLQAALREAVIQPFEFQGWQRQVRYKFTLTPLSPKGSLLEPGGRFNIPQINPTQIPAFPALYLAEDKETTLQEMGQGMVNGPLSSLDLALIQKDSITIVAVQGAIGSVIDLHQPKRLKGFFELIRDFPLPEILQHEAEGLGIPLPTPVKNLKTLLKTLLDPKWRKMPMQFDIPAPCQIFGQLVFSSGIEGIIYPSKFTGRKCLAIYPHNLGVDSFIAVEGEPPVEALGRLDSLTWKVMQATL